MQTMFSFTYTQELNHLLPYCMFTQFTGPGFERTKGSPSTRKYNRVPTELKLFQLMWDPHVTGLRGQTEKKLLHQCSTHPDSLARYSEHNS